MSNTLARCASLALIVLAVPFSALAQDSTIIVIDHAAGTFVEVYGSHGGVRKAVPARKISGIGTAALTVRTPDPVKVVFRNYVNALWDARFTAREFESPEYDLYEGLLAAIKPYTAELPLLLSTATAEREVPEHAVVKVIAFRDSIAALRSTTMWNVRELSLQDTMTKEEITATRRFAAQYLGWTGTRPRLRFLDSLAVWYDSLGHLKSTKEVTDLREQSKVLLTKATQLERALIRLSAIAGTAELNLAAQSTWKSGINLTVTVVSSEVMSFAGLDTTLTHYSITVLPDPIMRPISALSVILWAGADFESYSTERVAGSSIIRAAKADISHWSQGLSFGLAWRFLDFRDVKDKGFAVTVPELLVNPFDSFRGVGVGAGVSYAFLKLSVGALWIRNTVLDGQTVGNVIADPASLMTRPAYTPRLFFSLGVYSVAF